MGKKETKDKLENWYKLDNSADIYPMSLSRTLQSNYRMTITLKEDIVPEILKDALIKTYERYPFFKVKLKNGFFKYYFEENDLPVKIFPESDVFFETIDFKKNNRYLIKVIYFKKRISMDFFHGLTDGTGAFEFLKTLTYYYFSIAGKEYENTSGIKKIGDLDLEKETEDSTQKYYIDFPLNDKAISNMVGKNSFYIKEKFFARVGYGTIIGEMDPKKIVELAKRHDCTVTEYFAALALLSIQRTYLRKKEKDNFVVMIPLNLRRIFPSETLNNFTTMIRCQINQNVTPPDINSYISAIKADLREGIANKELLQKKLSVSALLSKKIYLRFIPSIIKAFFVKAPRTFFVKPKQTLIMSNMGVVNFPRELGDDVNRVTFHVNISKKTPNSIGIVTCNDKLTVSFTRRIVPTLMEKEFFSMLVQEGVDVKILSNYREISDAIERDEKLLNEMRQNYIKANRNLNKAKRKSEGQEEEN